MKKKSYEKLEKRIAELEGEIKHYKSDIFKYRAVFEEAKDGIGLADADTDILIDCNKALADLVGREVSELIGQSQKILHPPEDLKGELSDSFRQHRHEKVNQDVETRVITKEGEIKCVEIKANVLNLPNQKIIQGIFRNITERKKMEAELQESEDRLIKAQLLSGLGYWEWNAETDRVTWSKGLYALALLNENQSPPDFSEIHKVFTDESTRRLNEVVEKTIETGEPYDVDLEMVCADGSKKWISGHGEGIFGSNGQLTGIRGTVLDINDRKQAEEEKKKLQAQLLQSQKIESLGTLAGGIAHDFNNILFPIIGYCEILMDDLREDKNMQDDVKAILTSTLRAADLVKQILAFSRQGEHEMHPVNIQDIIHEVLSLIRHSLPSTINLSLKIDKACGTVMADTSQIHQVLMNLITNAYTAMENTKGTLEVGLKETDIGINLLPDPTLRPARYVDLYVSDSGTGIDEKIIGRIFDPFFTTQKNGKGTGLGLAVSHGIIKQHGGAIQALNRREGGAIFHVFLPVAQSVVDEKKPIIGAPSLEGKEHILLVDDELSVIKIVRLMLEQKGYTITSKLNSEDALITFKDAPDRFDILITDMTMPNMTGIELVEEIRKIRPEFPVIVCTGFSEQVDGKKANELGINGFAMKPILRDQLAAIIREALETEPDAGC